MAVTGEKEIPVATSPSAQRSVDRLTPDTLLLLMEERDKRYELSDKHLREMVEEKEKRYEQRFQAQEKAVYTAQQVIDARLTGMNEWRSTVTDIMATLMPRKEGEARTEMLGEKIDALSRTLTDKINSLNTVSERREGRSGGFSAGWGFLLGAIGGVVGLIGIVTAIMTNAAR